MRVLLFTSVLVLFFPLSILGNNLDSLLSISKDTSVPPWSRINAFKQLSQKYAYKNVDSMTYFRFEAYNIAKEINNDSMLVSTLNSLGSLYNFMGDFPKAIDYLNQAVDISKKMKDQYFMENIYEELGMSYCRNGNTVKGVKLFQKALDIFILKKNIHGQASINYELGSHYLIQGEYELAKEKYKKAKQLFQQLGQIEDVIFCIGSLGIALKKREPDQAILYFQEAAYLADSINAIGISAQAYNSIGELYVSQNNLDDAEKAYRKSLALHQKTGKETGQMEVSKNLGHLFLEKKEYQTSIKYCMKTHQFYEKNEYILLNKESCKCLYKAYQGTGNYKESLAYVLKYQLLTDSLYSREKTKELTEVKLNYEFEKEKELLALQKQKDEEVLITKNKQTRSAALGISAFALLALGFFFNARRKSKMISEQKEKLEQLNTTKDRIFAIIGHDLRKPAASFRGISKKVKYLLKKQDFETLDKLGNQIEQNALSLNKLTDNLLNWALTQRNVMPYNPIEVNVSDITADIKTIFETPAQEKNIRVVSNIDSAMMVFADPNALSTILTNLVDNAIKYTPKGGLVRIDALEENNRQIKIRVSDSGIGMEKDKINDVFLLQKNKSEKGTAGEKGTGLGLHLVKELVELNKGVINAISEIGKGTSFEVLLPALKE